MEKLIIFSAPSGSGKTTVVRNMLEEFDQLAFSISATTRQIREGEVHGKDYYFLSPETFKKGIANGDFLEYEEVYPDMFYGTLKSEVERLWSEGKAVVFDVDVVGGLNIKKYYEKKALAIFLRPPSIQELERRLTSRGTESDEQIKMRVEKAEKELKSESKFDIVLINNTLAETLVETKYLIRYFLNN
jgi:guanylate kinase